MSLYAELQRRKVFKVGGAYLVVAWLLIQVAATVAPQLQLPEWAPRMITLALMLGFPIALLLAWFLDRTAEGLRVERLDTGSKRIVAIAVALVALALGWYLRPGWESGPGGAAQEASSASASPADPGSAAAGALPGSPPPRSIAVLAFANLSDDKDNEFLADGLSEEILNALAQVRDLKVAGRTSSFHYKGRNEDLRTIGKALGVAHVLEGSVRRQGERVRITAQLVHADDGFHLWSETYDGDLSDVFALQERVARAVSDALQVTLSADQQAQLVDAGTANAEAYAMFLKAAAAYRRRDSVLYPDAIEQLERALALDPRFARAAARIGTMQAGLAAWQPIDATAATAARRYSEQALALDPGLAEPHATLGLLATRELRWLDARAAFERALELAPDDPDIVFVHGRHLLQTGYRAAGTERLDRALLIDPAHANALWRRALLSIDLGDFDAAARAFDRAQELGLSWAARGPLELAEARRDWPQARRLAEELNASESGSPYDGPDCLADPHADLRTIATGVYGGTTEERATALALIERCLASRPAVIPSQMQVALLRLGQPGRALAAIADGPTSGQASILIAIWGRDGVEARRLPQFADFARDYGYTEIWDRHGAPDGCRRVAPGEYACD